MAERIIPGKAVRDSDLPEEWIPAFVGMTMEPGLRNFAVNDIIRNRGSLWRLVFAG